MASEEGLKILLKAEVQDFLKDLKSAKDAITSTASSTADAVKSFLGLSSAAEDASKSLNEEATAATKSGQANASVGKFIRQMTYERKAALIEMRNGTNGWKLEAKAINDVVSPLQRAQKQTGNTRAAMAGLNNIVRDAPYGFGAVANNVTQLADALFGASLAANIASFGLSLIVTTGVELVKKYGSLSNAIAELTGGLTAQQKAQQAVAASLKGAEGEYTNAVARVSELKNEISLAKQGFIDKDQVVKHYNETIGKTTGEVKTLEQAEKSLQKNAEAYIKFTLLKAAANQALEAAAKKAFEAEIERSKSDEESSSYILSGLTNSADSTVQNLYKKAAARNRKIASDEAEKDRATLEDIAKKFEEQAAAISKSFKFDFFGGDQDGKGGDVKTISDILKELDHQITAINTKFAATGGTAKEIGKELQNAYEKALEALSKLGVSTDSQIFGNIKKEIERIQKFVNSPELNLRQPQITIPIIAEVRPVPAASNKGTIQSIAEGVTEDFGRALSSELVTLNQAITRFLQESALTAIETFGSALGGLIAGGGIQDAIKNFANVFGGYLQELGKSLIVYSGILKGLQSAIASLNPSVAAVAGFAAIAAGAALKSFASDIPAFATGGVVNGPTLAMVGDNPSGIEYMIPKEVLDKVGNSGSDFIAETRLSGSDILVVVKRAGLNQSRING